MAQLFDAIGTKDAQPRRHHMIYTCIRGWRRCASFVLVHDEGTHNMNIECKIVRTIVWQAVGICPSSWSFRRKMSLIKEKADSEY